MDIEQQREIELRTYIAEQVAPVIWKAIRRDVIAGLALQGVLAWSGPMSTTHKDRAEYCVKSANTLVAELDKEKPNE